MKPITDRTKMTRGRDIAYQEKEREYARLRRIGRGRKRILSTSGKENYDNIRWD